MCLPGMAEGKGTSAGTSISTVATATYMENGVPIAITSNTASVRVQEVIDVLVEPGSTERLPVLPGEAGRALPFRITNSGNGVESFRLGTRTNLGGDNFDPVCAQIFLDDGSGAFESTSDKPYAPGTNDPELKADGSITVFAICAVSDTVNNADVGNVMLEARAATLDREPSSGSGGPGTLFSDPTRAGIDAIVGPTAAKASAINGMIVAASTPSLTKTQRVTDPSGGTSPIAGAIVTYTISTDIRSGSITNAIVADPIPSGTAYEPGSLAIADGNGGFTSLTDAADTDAGRFDGQTVEFNLGQITAEAPARSVRFQVRINQQ